MLVFEVYINGKRVAKAGTEELSVLSANVSAVGKLGAETSGGKFRDLWLHVGGLVSRKSGADREHLRWARKDLRVGDEVMVRVLESNSSDTPKSSKREKQTREAYERGEFESVKKMYFKMRDKYEGKPKLVNSKSAVKKTSSRSKKI